MEFEAQRVADLWPNGYLVLADFVCAVVGTPLGRRLESSALKAYHNIVRGYFLAGIDAIRCGVDLGGVLEDFPAQFSVDDPRVVIVVVEDGG